MYRNDYEIFPSHFWPTVFGTGTQTYNGTWYTPSTAAFNALIQNNYIDAKDVFKCPSDIMYGIGDSTREPRGMWRRSVTYLQNGPLKDMCSYAYGHLNEKYLGIEDWPEDRTVLAVDRSWAKSPRSAYGCCNHVQNENEGRGCLWEWNGSDFAGGVDGGKAGLPGVNHGEDGVNVLFLNGSVEWIADGDQRLATLAAIPGEVKTTFGISFGGSYAGINMNGAGAGGYIYNP